MTRHYVPPLRFPALTGLYDHVVRLSTRESAVKGELVNLAGLGAGESALDLGCGTATLTLALARSCPQARVCGVDADAQALGMARRKAAAAGIGIELQRAMAQKLPFGDASFDVVASSLFFHHLTREAKRAVLAEVTRVLKPQGRVVIGDWGRPANVAARWLFLPVQLLDGFETTRDSVAGVLPELLERAGLRDVAVVRHLATPLGTMGLYRARRGAPARAVAA